MSTTHDCTSSLSDVLTAAWSSSAPSEPSSLRLKFTVWSRCPLSSQSAIHVSSSSSTVDKVCVDAFTLRLLRLLLRPAVLSLDAFQPILQTASDDDSWRLDALSASPSSSFFSFSSLSLLETFTTTGDLNEAGADSTWLLLLLVEFLLARGPSSFDDTLHDVERIKGTAGFRAALLDARFPTDVPASKLDPPPQKPCSSFLDSSKYLKQLRPGKTTHKYILNLQLV